MRPVRMPVPTTALAAGLDSTWHLLRLTRQAFREGDSLGGVAHFIDGGGRGPRHRWHSSTSAGTCSGSSRRRSAQRGSALADSSRGTWVRDRLIERDVRDGRPPGSRLAEHFARLEHVEKHFRLCDSLRVASALTAPRPGVFQGVTETGKSTDGTTLERIPPVAGRLRRSRRDLHALRGAGQDRGEHAGGRVPGPTSPGAMTLMARRCSSRLAKSTMTGAPGRRHS